MFQISALSKSRFEQLFGLSDEELKAHGALRRTATKKPGFPCRVSLQDAEPGEEVLLVHFEHQSADTPFRSSHAVYVRPSAREARLKEGEVPELLRSRTLSVRAFASDGMMIDASIIEGSKVENEIERQLAQSATCYIHLHFAMPGCYIARADRAQP
jgi:hypothetical protein